MFVAPDTDEVRVIFSASDLDAAVSCEYALLRSFDVRLGRGPVVAADDELLSRTEPPISAMVFISTTASSIADVPLGMTFLLNRNRLNFAVSRAKYPAVIVRSERLTDYLPGTPDGLMELGAFMALERG